MAALAVTTLLLLASACCIESALVFKSRRYPGSGLGIYGGDKVNYTVPYYAFLFLDKYLPCQAVIVDKQHLLTTGYCASLMNVNHRFYYAVVLGTNDYDAGGRLYDIENVFIHPKFVFNYSPREIVWDYDIAVIKLKRNITFFRRIKPIKMADPDFVLKDGDRVVSYGMGETADMVIPLHLRSVSLPYYDHEKCAENYQRTSLNVTDRFFCAGGELGKSGASGDYGGPVVYNNNTLVGLFSYCLFPDVNSNVPSAFINIAVVRPWIDSIIKMDE